MANETHDLQRIRDEVLQFGRALDAADRGYGSVAAQMEARASEAIRDIVNANPAIAKLLPGLVARLALDEDLADRGYEILAELDAATETIARETDGALGQPRRCEGGKITGG